MDYVKYIRNKTGSDKIILNCAGVMIIDKDNRVLLQHRKDNNEWGLIGGVVELDETYKEAAIRETREETGLDINIDYFLGIYHNYNMVWKNGDMAHVIGAYYKASIKSGILRTDEESLELKFFDKKDIPYLFAEDHRKVIDDYYNNKIHNNNDLNEK